MLAHQTERKYIYTYIHILYIVMEMHDMKVTLQYYLLWHEDYSVRPCENPSVRFLIKLEGHYPCRVSPLLDDSSK